jgi:hypothetical protein
MLVFLISGGPGFQNLTVIGQCMYAVSNDCTAVADRFQIIILCPDNFTFGTGLDIQRVGISVGAFVSTGRGVPETVAGILE